MKGWLWTLLFLCSFLTACSSAEETPPVIVASKQFTENVLLSEMYAQLIEQLTDLEVERKQNMGATAVCYTAMEKGEVDLYVEYTGTIYTELLGGTYDTGIDPGTLYDLIKRDMQHTKGITLFQPIGLNNAYALAMLKAKADSLGIETMSDLNKDASRLVFAANALYFTRLNDGYDTLLDKYGYHFKSVAKMNNDLLYEAVYSDQVDVIVTYATDALLPKYEMVVLEDDKHMFPDYYALPIIRSDVLEKYPELNHVLDLLANRISNEQMQVLNYSVDIENKGLEAVASAFLAELGLLPY